MLSGTDANYPQTCSVEVNRGRIDKYEKDYLKEKLFTFVMEFITLTCYEDV